MFYHGGEYLYLIICKFSKGSTIKRGEVKLKVKY